MSRKKSEKKAAVKEPVNVLADPKPAKPKKVAIVGCSQSKSLAPFDDESFEIWGVNNLYPHIPRATRWFEIHELTKNGNTFYRRGNPEFRGQKVNEYVEQLGKWAAEHNCPVYTQRLWEEMPTATVYPVNEVLQQFGNYFTNSISWMLALAIREGFEEIHVYGVDMAVDTEYHHQRPSCEYFLGIAAGLGIKLFIPAEADLLKTRWLYAFQEKESQEWDKKVKMMRQTINEKRDRIQKEINQFQNEIEFRKQQMQQYIGAEHALSETDKIWS